MAPRRRRAPSSARDDDDDDDDDAAPRNSSPAVAVAPLGPSSLSSSSSLVPLAMPGLPNLPACQACAARKVKCDSRRPACAACAKAGAACLLKDPDGGPAVSRAYLHELEQKARRVDAGLLDAADAPAQETPQTAVTDESALEETETSSTVLQGGGLSFMSLLFNNRRWPDLDAELGPLSGPARTAEAAIEAHPLPSASTAHLLFQEYLAWSHIQNPFLLRQEVLDVYDRVFAPARDRSPTNKHDLFRAFMILAIGSVIPFRKGSHHSHPLGYYLAAMKNWSCSLLANGVDTIQDLLLVCRFAIYHQIGTSIWEVVRLCMRLCVEQGLQKQRPGSPDLLAEQKRRRVFWTCYIMDRYSSVTLNRPFAVADRDIHVAFPAEADDDEVTCARGLLPDLDTFCDGRLPTSPDEMSVLLLCVRLRQVSSKIQTQFAALTRTSSRSCEADESLFGTGRVYVMVDKMLRELETWRSTCPVFEHPKCLFERQGWYDLLLAREKINLVRKAIDFIPKRNGVPPKYILDLCLESASQTIRLYSDMFSRSLITYTRSYFQLLFTAGLSILFCVSVGTGLDAAKVREVQKTMVTCRDTLAVMVGRLPDARRYLAVFEALKQNILMKLGGAVQSGSVVSSPVPLNNAPVQHHARATQAVAGHTGQYAATEAWNDHGTQSILGYCASQQQQPHGDDMDGHYAAQQATGATGAFGQQPADCLVDWSFLNDMGLWDVNTYVYGDPSDFHGGLDAVFGEFSGAGPHQGSHLMDQ